MKQFFWSIKIVCGHWNSCGKKTANTERATVKDQGEWPLLLNMKWSHCHGRLHQRGDRGPDLLTWQPQRTLLCPFRAIYGLYNLREINVGFTKAADNYAVSTWAAFLSQFSPWSRPWNVPTWMVEHCSLCHMQPSTVQVEEKTNSPEVELLVNEVTESAHWYFGGMPAAKINTWASI